jgi:sporulation-specific protein 1
MSVPRPSPVDNYQFHELIGRGNFGDVYRATNRVNSRLVAIKVTNLDEGTEDIKVLIQEIQFLSRLKSPYITKYFEAFVQDVNMFIVMEYCGGSSCSDLLRFHKKFPEDVVCFIIRDVLKGLCYIHQEGKVHRDIKLANILLTDCGEVKLADFGVSGQITHTHAKRNTFVGTPFWMAPEVIVKKRDANTGYDEKADIWSAGITTIELVTGAPPMAEHDPMKILFEIPKKRPPILVGAAFGDNIKDFVKYCLIKDPKRRPAAKTLLHHLFVSKPSRKIQDKLAQFILERKQIVLSKVSKKARHNISESPSENKMEWDFKTFKMLYQETNNSKIAIKSSKSSESLEPLEHFNDNLPSGSPEMIITKAHILFYSLEQVYHRGRNHSTKVTVQKLINNLLEYEQEQPGLCEAIVDEIFHIK